MKHGGRGGKGGLGEEISSIMLSLVSHPQFQCFKTSFEGQMRKWKLLSGGAIHSCPVGDWKIRVQYFFKKGSKRIFVHTSSSYFQQIPIVLGMGGAGSGGKASGRGCSVFTISFNRKCFLSFFASDEWHTVPNLKTLTGALKDLPSANNTVKSYPLAQGTGLESKVKLKAAITNSQNHPWKSPETPHKTQHYAVPH